MNNDNIEKLLADMRSDGDELVAYFADRLEAMTREPVFPTDEESRAGGWTLSFSFLKEIQKRAILKTEEVSYIELEDIESVLLAARNYFTAPPSPSMLEPEYGCHCDIENTVSGKPDGCVIDSHDYEDCVYARPGMRKEDCEYWRPIVLSTAAPKGVE